MEWLRQLDAMLKAGWQVRTEFVSPMHAPAEYTAHAFRPKSNGDYEWAATGSGPTVALAISRLFAKANRNPFNDRGQP